MNQASRNLKAKKGAKYVLHNLEPESIPDLENCINLQVFSKTSIGEPVDSSIAKWHQESKTLFQPWGISLQPALWLDPQRGRNVEYWVGSIWNDSAGAGNIKEMEEYVQALSSYGISFRQVGGMRNRPTILNMFRRLGLGTGRPVSELKARDLVSISPAGSAIVGGSHIRSAYVPCRVFKNLAAGHPPNSNADYSFVFGNDLTISNSSISQLLAQRFNLGATENYGRVKAAQEKMRAYTYEKAIMRILQSFA